jgi:hypothetical protein
MQSTTTSKMDFDILDPRIASFEPALWKLDNETYT